MSMACPVRWGVVIRKFAQLFFITIQCVKAKLLCKLLLQMGRSRQRNMVAETILIASATEALVRKALSLAAQEIGLTWHFKEDLKSLAEKFQMMRAVLVDAESKNIDFQTMKLWLEKLNSVASEADDILETCAYEVLRQNLEKPNNIWHKVCNFYLSPVKRLAFRVKMSHKIKTINDRLDNVTVQASKFGLSPVEMISSRHGVLKVLPREVTSPAIDGDIVGRDTDESKVVEMLVRSNTTVEISVIGIVGMAGQGKTTLARLVYRHKEVVEHFDHRNWVCVSENFGVDRILDEMAQSLTKTEANKFTNKGALLEKLKETLESNRYLLVLDDVWNEDPRKWESLRNDLLVLNGSRGSKIMVTTRNMKVVETMQPSDIYQIHRLSEEDSWSLLKRRVFGNNGSVRPELEEIGLRILQRCMGVPLAIKALGFLLASKNDAREWSDIENSELWSSNNAEDQIYPSIKLSYYHLPSQSLRQCFAYCSIFPKNSIIERESLIQQWVAQGFISTEVGSGRHMEDIGNDYFNILLWSSLLQEPVSSEGVIWSCKMHDLVHDFAVHITKRNFSAVHLSLVCSNGILEMFEGGSSNSTTLLHVKAREIGDVLAKFKQLRVLILKGSQIKTLPASIGKLKKLRFLDISDSQIETLPHSITKLYNLQTLRVPQNLVAKVFLNQLINLRHIHGPSLKIRGIKQLAHLQTIPGFKVGSQEGSGIEELSLLNHLKGRLTLCGLEKLMSGDEAREANLSRKSKIVKLELIWDNSHWRTELTDEDVLEAMVPPPYLRNLKIEGFMGWKFSSWIMAAGNNILHCLETLSLDSCPRVSCLPSFDGLTNLRHLKIRKCKSLPRLPSLEGLVSLEDLTLVDLDIRILPDTTTGLPSLRSLQIDSCSILSRLPDWLWMCALLEQVSITHCPNLISMNGLQHMPNLKTLEVGLLNVDIDYMPAPDYDFLWPRRNDSLQQHSYFASLEELILKGWANVSSSLPGKVQSLPLLKKLKIRDSSLEALPDWLGRIRSIQFLIIDGCENLKSLPSLDAMQCLTNLQTLQFERCPALAERCVKEIGSEWYKIAHIPNIKVDRNWIQRQS